MSKQATGLPLAGNSGVLESANCRMGTGRSAPQERDRSGEVGWGLGQRQEVIGTNKVIVVRFAAGTGEKFRGGDGGEPDAAGQCHRSETAGEPDALATMRVPGLPWFALMLHALMVHAGHLGVHRGREFGPPGIPTAMHQAWGKGVHGESDREEQADDPVQAGQHRPRIMVRTL